MTSGNLGDPEPVVSSPRDTAADGPHATGSLRLASDQLINIADIRAIFKLGRTAAYELTHRPGFPDPIRVSPRCYRWLASEVDAFAAALRSERSRPAQPRPARPRLADPETPSRRITGRVRVARTSRIRMREP